LLLLLLFEPQTQASAEKKLPPVKQFFDGLTRLDVDHMMRK